MKYINRVTAEDYNLPEGDDNRPQSILEADLLSCFPNSDKDQEVAGIWNKLMRQYQIHTTGTNNVTPWVSGMNALIDDWNTLLAQTNLKAPSPQAIRNHFGL